MKKIEILSVSNLYPATRPANGSDGTAATKLTSDSYVVTENLEFKIRIRGRVRLLIVPAGFIFDGFSIPSLLRPFFYKHGMDIIAAILHDYLYNTRALGVDKETADRLMWEAMWIVYRDSNQSFLKKRKIYWRYFGVAVGGHIAWHSNGRKIKRDRKGYFLSRGIKGEVPDE